ncbi:MAG: cupin domain-containing protein [Petrimonas sp.]|nr:cupin domain-containing protein [Petrimonas sp.]
MKNGIICLLLTLAGIAPVLAQNNPEKAGKEYTIDNCVSEFTPGKAQQTKVGYQYYFVDRDFVDGRTLKMSVVAPKSATHAPHRHAMDEFFFILEGTAEVYLDGKTKIIKPYTSFYCPPDSEHGIRNVGDTELKYLVIKKEK